ncbi:hypothetical protein ABI_04560 [Asticcacaulis biprosthecium C19]|uniref:Lipoprotein n=1 Tax=Asticcacaulis biprosthecium C19 TaxID=715226 RepID=F4QJZ7_9CAUL|nr:LPS assembly lipoprotein LptE [Asticcacaulis biprosthecium]EGF92024.1 hypothetical protein ABI_04560 [Asticcacaulis biprosthecium C19]
MRTALKLLCLGVLAISPVTLSGCAGYTALYAERVTVNMAQIGLEVPQTRTGYYLEQDLRNGFGADDVSPKLYKLTVTMTERHYSIGYRVDETSTRSEITSRVSYVLTDTRTNKRLTRGNFSETVTFNTSQSPFTGVVSQQDAQERIAATISDRIQADLALYFHQKAK